MNDERTSAEACNFNPLKTLISVVKTKWYTLDHLKVPMSTYKWNIFTNNGYTVFGALENNGRALNISYLMTY